MLFGGVSSESNCPKFNKICPFLFILHACSSFLKYALYSQKCLVVWDLGYLVRSVVLQIACKVKSKHFKQNRTNQTGFVIAIIFIANSFRAKIVRRNILIMFDLETNIWIKTNWGLPFLVRHARQFSVPGFFVQGLALACLQRLKY